MKCKTLYGDYDFKFKKISPIVNKIDHKESFLIIYPDGIRAKNKKSLEVLNEFSTKYLQDFSTIHLLPFYPSSSDKGFAVTNYIEVDPQYGTWKNIQDLARNFKLMFEAVLNHTSSRHTWFKNALQKKENYVNYFISYDSKVDTSMVFRPRNKPVLSKYDKYYWTTFSRDQIDLNFRNPKVAEEIIKVLNYYVSNGAKYIRLDAIAYLFKDPLKSSIDSKETHEFINFLLKNLPSGVKLISEVNLGEEIVDSYRKHGLVYNFQLPPLVYYSFLSGNLTPLFKYLQKNKQNNFNILASHDGIGVTPVKNYLSEDELDLLVKDVENKGFKVTYSRGPYELNINYFDALDRDERKMLCAHSLLLSLKGIPGIYYHSLFGSFGKIKYDHKYPRSLNRAVLSLKSLERELGCNSIRNRIYNGITNMLKQRNKTPAFDPKGSQKVKLKGKILIIEREFDNSKIVCYHNFGEKAIEINSKKDVLTGKVVKIIPPYGYIWA